jgi:hypothetical protein
MSDETYGKMCLHPVIQNRWKPKIGDQYLFEGHTGVLQEGFLWLFAVNNFMWIPCCEDMVEMLKDQLWRISHWRKPDQHFYMELDRLEGPESFGGESMKSVLVQAFMWTQGFKWEDDKWVSRVLPLSACP